MPANAQMRGGQHRRNGVRGFPRIADVGNEIDPQLRRVLFLRIGGVDRFARFRTASGSPSSGILDEKSAASVSRRSGYSCHSSTARRCSPCAAAAGDGARNFFGGSSPARAAAGN